MKSEWLRAAVYGGSDGIITTFAVVSGVAGASLGTNVVFILGIGNMIADGLSMGLGDYMGSLSEFRYRKRLNKAEPGEGDDLWQTGLITFLSFVAAGSLPLI